MAMYRVRRGFSFTLKNGDVILHPAEFDSLEHPVEDNNKNVSLLDDPKNQIKSEEEPKLKVTVEVTTTEDPPKGDDDDDEEKPDEDKPNDEDQAPGPDGEGKKLDGPDENKAMLDTRASKEK